MAIKIGSTKDATSSGIKCLIFGASGAGKTRLASTLTGNTLILSAEAGLLSLKDFDIPSTTINSLQELKDAYSYLVANPDIINIYIDSLSEIAENILEHAKTNVKDGRMAYGEMAEQVVKVVKGFRDLDGRNVIMVAKVERTKDELTGAVLYSPSFPGNKLGQNLPYLFDQVLALRIEKDIDGNIVRYLQTQRDEQWDAKDRSGKLDMFEPADLSEIFSKIIGSTVEG